MLDGDSVKAHQLSRWLDGGPVAAFEGLATLWYLVDVPTVTMPVLPTPKVTGKNRKPARASKAFIITDLRPQRPAENQFEGREKPGRGPRRVSQYFRNEYVPTCKGGLGVAARPRHCFKI